MQDRYVITERVHVEVTAEDITKGQESIRNLESRCKNCAVARAIQRTLNLPAAAWAYGDGDVIVSHRVTYYLSVPEGSAERQKVASFVHAHDRLEEVQPFSFTLIIEKGETCESLQWDPEEIQCRVVGYEEDGL